MYKLLDAYEEYTIDRNIDNIAGDFYTFCIRGYKKPVKSKNKQITKPANMTNFKQREYSAEELNEFYYDTSLE